MLLMVVDFITHVVTRAKIDRLLFWHRWLFRKVHTLINSDVHFFNEDAVSWHTITLVDIHDVSNNKISDWNALNCPEGTPIHRNALFIDLVFQLKELTLFYPVGEASNKAAKHDTTVYGKRLNIGKVVLLRVED